LNPKIGGFAYPPQHKVKISLANPNCKKIEVSDLELGGGSASPQKLFILLFVQLQEL
jgi:hypothetical protein